jgi:sugar lactone lactonase YvrE
MALGPRGRIYLLLPELNAIARYDDLRSAARILIRPGKKIPLGSAAQIFVDHRGDVFATVPGKHRVYKFDQNGALLASFGSRGKGPGQFSKPQGVAGNSDDQVVIADSGNARVQMLRVEGESGPSLEQLDRSLPVVRLLTSRSLGAGVNDVEWPSVDTFAALGSRSARVVLQQEETRVLGKPGKSRGQLRTPKGMAIADDGRVLVADTGNHRVQIFDTRGEPNYVFGGRGSEPGMFSAPEDVAINREGNVYVADTGNHRIQVFSDQGIFLTAFGKKSRGKGAQAEAGAFKDPSGLVIDSANRVLVLDRGNARVQLFSENGDFLRSLGPVPGLSALALDEWGNIYLGSQSCLCVRVFDPQGEKQLLRFGSGADGPAQLTSVTALAVLEDQVQVVDGLTGNSRVFQLFLDGLQKERRISITRSYFVPVFEAGSEDALPRYREAAVAAGLEELAETLNAPVAQLRHSLRIEADEKVDEGEYRIQISVTALDEPEPAVEPAVTPPPPPPKGLGLK